MGGSLYKANLLEGQVACITGGTSGINLGIAKAFANHGARVIVMGRSAERGAAAIAEIEAETGRKADYEQLDVRDYDSLEAAFARISAAHGAITTVVAGAAGNFSASAVNLSANAFKTVVEIDLIGTFNTFRAAYDHLHPNKASLLAITTPNATQSMPFQSHASAAKAGVNMLVKSLALEWGGRGIRVNAISPGPIAGTEGASARTMPEGMDDKIIKTTPLHRFGAVAEVANAAIFLASDLSSYTTGHILDVEGGLLLGDASRDALTVTPRQKS